MFYFVCASRINNYFIQLKATNGDIFLGGKDFDYALLESLVCKYKRTKGIDLAMDWLALQSLRERRGGAWGVVDSQINTEPGCNIGKNGDGCSLLWTIVEQKCEALWIPSSLGNILTSVSRSFGSFLIDAIPLLCEAYEALLKAHEEAINALNPGNKVCAAYQLALSVVEKDAPELVPNLTKSAGTDISLEFRESGLILNAKNDRVVKAKMILNVSVTRFLEFAEPCQKSIEADFFSATC
ncbi:hypothetical protein QYF36_011656 [Acer negundo]|nr:hypothetical protein QYF36_011656 [Acer negundo]